MGVIRGDARSLDYSSYEVAENTQGPAKNSRHLVTALQAVE